MEQLVEFTNNNLLLVGATVAMALAVAFYELRLRAGSVSAVSPVQVVRLINQGAKVVDIRDQAPFDAGHIVDAIHVPAAELQNNQDQRLKKAKSIILVCDNGAKSGQTVAAMKKDGNDNAFSLMGGMAAWQKDNLPIVSANTPAQIPHDNDSAKSDT